MERALRRRHARRVRLAPDDLDVAALYAEALMNRTPWQLWDLPHGRARRGRQHGRGEGGAGAGDRDRGRPRHPGRAAPVHPPDGDVRRPGDRRCAPPTGCAASCPTPATCSTCRPTSTCSAVTTSAWCRDNTAAIVADEKFLERDGAMNFYTLYRVHNYHFKIYGAMFLRAVRDRAGRPPRSSRRHPGGAAAGPGAADGRLARGVPRHARPRADPLRQMGRRSSTCRCPTTRALLRHDGDDSTTPRASPSPPPAGSPRPRPSATCSVRRSPGSRRPGYCSTTPASTSSPSPSAMLDGELEYRKGNFDAAFAAPAALDRTATTTCPTTSRGAGCSRPGTPTARCCWSRAASRRPKPSTAADLGLDEHAPARLQHPDNVWTLHGYHECLVRLGRDGEARIMAQQLRIALALADVPIEASCFCRLDVGAEGDGADARCHAQEDIDGST